MNKGCLIGGIVGAVVLGLIAVIAVVIGGLYYVGKNSEQASAKPAVQSPANPVSASDIPNDATARQMVNNTMLNFKNAVNSGNFEPFYRTQLSDFWKKQTTPQQLQTSFKTFIDRKVDLSPIFAPSVQSGMVIDPAPYIDKDGLLVLKGYYPVPSEKVSVAYELSYSREAKWGLTGINVRVKAIDES